jgi:FkbM family methyltransferase
MTPDVLEQLAEAPPPAWDFASPAPVYVYGAGNVGKAVARLLQKRGAKLAGFLDRNAKPGAVWQGLPILLPDQPPDRKQARVVIGIFNRDVEILPIVRMLTDLRFAQITTFVDFHAGAVAELGDHFWLTARDFYRGRAQEITQAAALFSDEASRELFNSIVQFRLTGDYTILRAPRFEDQYFPGDIPAWTLPLRLADCGAYDGDTVRELARRQLPVEALAAFEPDAANFAKLAQTARELLPHATASLIPCGVAATTSQVRFTSGLGSSSAVSENGDTVIQCVALDEALAAFRPNLIKMDIEGAEYDALLGACGLISKHRPGLAISVYHRAEHLWTIPLLVQSWLRGGRHYLRSHAHTGFELIYYWMP